jgi:hypothetical protein
MSRLDFFLYLNELSYKGNIGFHELVLFYRKANDNEIEEMEGIIKSENWNKFKKLVKKVLSMELV